MDGLVASSLSLIRERAACLVAPSDTTLPV